MRTCLYSLVLKDFSPEEVVEVAAGIGYEAIEWRGREPHLGPETGLERAAEIAQICRERGLAIASLATYAGGFSTKSDEECERELSALRKFFSLAEAMGCDLVRVNPGGPSPREASEEHWRRATEWVRRAADAAGEWGLRLTMEIHHGALVEDANSALRLLELIGRENVGVTFDPGNMFIAGVDYGPEAVRALGGRIFHLHVKGEKRAPPDDPDAFECGGRKFLHTLIEEGEVDYLPVLRALKEAGFEGFASVETHVGVYKGYKPLETRGEPLGVFVARRDFEALTRLMEEAGVR